MRRSDDLFDVSGGGELLWVKGNRISGKERVERGVVLPSTSFSLEIVNFAQVSDGYKFHLLSHSERFLFSSSIRSDPFQQSFQASRQSSKQFFNPNPLSQLHHQKCISKSSSASLPLRPPFLLHPPPMVVVTAAAHPLATTLPSHPLRRASLQETATPGRFLLVVIPSCSELDRLAALLIVSSCVSIDWIGGIADKATISAERGCSE